MPFNNSQDTTTLTERLKSLEEMSRHLDTPPADFGQWMDEITQFAKNFLTDLPGSKAAKDTKVTAIREKVPTHPVRFEKILEFLSQDVLTSGLNAASGKYMAYVPGGGIPTAAIGDFLSALTNRYSGNYGACPAAAEIENICIQWLIEMVGFPRESWGTLTSGGTLAALTGLVAARNTRPPSEWHKGVIPSLNDHHAFHDS